MLRVEMGQGRRTKIQEDFDRIRKDLGQIFDLFFCPVANLLCENILQ